MPLQRAGRLFWTKDNGTICYRQDGCQAKRRDCRLSGIDAAYADIRGLPFVAKSTICCRWGHIAPWG
jgi:hypothetical protein